MAHLSLEQLDLFIRQALYTKIWGGWDGPLQALTRFEMTLQAYIHPLHPSNWEARIPARLRLPAGYMGPFLLAKDQAPYADMLAAIRNPWWYRAMPRLKRLSPWFSTFAVGGLPTLWKLYRRTIRNVRTPSRNPFLERMYQKTQAIPEFRRPLLLLLPSDVVFHALHPLVVPYNAVPQPWEIRPILRAQPTLPVNSADDLNFTMDNS